MRLQLISGSAVLLLPLLTACGPGGFGGPGPGPRPMAEPVSAVAVSDDSVPAIPGFSSAIRRGLVLYVSGQGPLDSEAHIVGDGDIRRQTKQAMGNLIRLVRAARGLPGDVVQLTVYIADLSAEDAAAVQEVARTSFTESPPPAITIVGVARLPEQGMRIAVDGVAVLRSEFPDRERMAGGARMAPYAR